MSLDAFHPLVQAWFGETLGTPSEPQRLGWPAIAEGAHTLILAPTGTGKTLAAFLWELNQLIVRGLEAPLPNGVQILYVSPLKALSNDIHRNLERPLAELQRRFSESGLSFPEIRIGVRTGDTPAAARASMTRRAPHILITTPESLHIMLTTTKGRGMFSLVRAVIIDEIHAVAGSKRGVHLALSLERLQERCEAPPQRIGLSATQRPLEEIARFLGGCASRSAAEAPVFRPVSIIDCGLVKRMTLAIASAVSDPSAIAGSIWPHVAALALARIRGARTTLIFVNNRGQAERMAARINGLAGEEVARPYHGSLARERRLGLERALKAGELRALVTTSSLELGIDIGSVDLVLQLQSPKRVSAGLQRVGRSGHSLGEASAGVFVPTFRDDLLETAAIVEAMRGGEVEPTRVPQNALDVLAQGLVAMASVDDWTSADAYALVRRAYPYHRLTRAAFDEVLGMLSGKYPSDLVAELEPRLTWDRVSDRVTGTRASRLLAVVSGGTIPDRGLYTAVLPDRTRLGELDEEFVHESRVGDVFQLGSATWRIGAIERDRVIVTPAPGAPARMPFWHGEYSARAAELSGRVGALRRELAALEPDDDAGVQALATRLGADLPAARGMRAYVAEQRAATGVIPDDRTVVVEHFRDEMGAVRVVLHSVFGGRVNAPWGMVLGQRVRDALRGADCQVQTSDDGILFRMPDAAAPVPMHALLDLRAEEARHRIVDEVGHASLFGARFRMNAARALILGRWRPNRRMPLWLQRLRALDLLEAVRAIPTFPVLVETYREVLDDAFDLPALMEVLESIAAGRIAVRVVETEGPSPFAAGLQFGFMMEWLYTDDTPRAEREAAMLAVDPVLLSEVMGGAQGAVGSDDTTMQALTELVADRRGTSPRRRARTADELAHVLDQAGDLALEELHLRAAPREGWIGVGDAADELLRQGRVIEIQIPARDGGVDWRVILVENFPRYAAAFGRDTLDPVRTWTTEGIAPQERSVDDALPQQFRNPVVEPRVARREILTRFVSLAGPVTVREIAERYGWDETWIRARLTEWEAANKLMRAKFRREVSEPEWCLRALVDRARRRALAAVRRQIEPVDLSTFGAFLRRWQHLDPRDRLSGPEGVKSVLRQLAGLPRPPERWERDYLPSRLERYDAAWLSHLASTGQLVWAGMTREDRDGVPPNLSAIRFFPREDSALWIGPDHDSDMAPSAPAQRVVEALRRNGASFLADLQAATGLTPVVLREALRELVALGRVTNDTVEAMREVVRTWPLPPREQDGGADASRWLPSHFTPSVGRPVVQRRASIRRLPKWRRPDLPGPTTGWVGRWSLLHLDRVPSLSEDEHAELVARRWLDRYGIVTSDWWRRERPPVAWRSVYRELKRLEYRGEVRRGYFVEGMAGAQFALPAAVEQLRAAREEGVAAPMVVLAASDPANPFTLPLMSRVRSALENPRGAGALLAVRGNVVVLSAESMGRRLTVCGDADAADVTAAAHTLGVYVRRRRESVLGGARTTGDVRARCVVEQIDGEPAGVNRWGAAVATAGFRRVTQGFEFDPLRE